LKAHQEAAGFPDETAAFGVLPATTLATTSAAAKVHLSIVNESQRSLYLPLCLHVEEAAPLRPPRQRFCIEASTWPRASFYKTSPA